MIDKYIHLLEKFSKADTRKSKNNDIEILKLYGGEKHLSINNSIKFKIETIINSERKMHIIEGNFSLLIRFNKDGDGIRIKTKEVNLDYIQDPENDDELIQYQIQYPIFQYWTTFYKLIEEYSGKILVVYHGDITDGEYKLIKDFLDE